MGAILAVFLKKNWLPIGIGLAVLAVAGGLYFKGRADGRAIEAAETKQATFDQIKERNVTDAKVRKMPDPELCRAIGGELRGDRCE